MRKLLPNMGNATYSGAGQLAPLLNDPQFETIGIGTHIFLCGGEGIVTGEGTQHNPTKGYGTLMLQGDLKQMKPEYLVGASFKGYGTTAYIGLGIPIPVLNERIAKNCAIKDEEIMTTVQDYSTGRRDRPTLKTVSYKELKSGKIEVNGTEIRVSSLSSLYKAHQVADCLKKWIQKGSFMLYQPVKQLSTTTLVKSMKESGAITFVKSLKKRAITVSVDAELPAVAKLVLEKNDNHVVIVDELGKLVGFMTTFDLAKAIAGKGDRIRDIMIPRNRVHTVKETDPIDVAVRMMKQYSISSLPVTDSNDKVLGIITAEELIRTEEKEKKVI